MKLAGTNIDSRILAGIVLAICVIFLFIFRLGNPSGSLVDYNVTRQDALQIGRDYLDSLGIDTSNYRSVIANRDDIEPDGIMEGHKFLKELGVGYDHEELRSYLYRSGGKEALERVYTQHIAPAEWIVCIFNDTRFQEYILCVDTRRGAVNAYNFQIPDTTRLPSLSGDEAVNVARELLRNRGLSPESFILVNSKVYKGEYRDDHELRFQTSFNHSDNMEDARLVYDIRIHGNRVDFFSSRVKIPEQVRLKQNNLKMISEIYTYFQVGSVLALIVVFLGTGKKLLHKTKPKWKHAICAGLLFVVAGLLSDFVTYEKTLVLYDSALAFQTFLYAQIKFSMFIALIMLVVFGLLWVVATSMVPEKLEVLYKPWSREQSRGAMFSGGIAVVIWILLDPNSTISISSLLLRDYGFGGMFQSPDEISAYIPALNISLEALLSSIMIFLVVFCLLFLFKRYLGNRSLGIRIVVILIAFVLVLNLEFKHVGSMSFGVDALKNAIPIGYGLLLLFYFWRGKPHNALVGFYVLLPIESIWNYAVLSHPSYRQQAWLAFALLVIPFIILGWRAFKPDRSPSNSKVTS